MFYKACGVNYAILKHHHEFLSESLESTWLLNVL